MRILSIRGANIASLTEFEIALDRDPLRSAGLFAIVGPTGSGKSSLLDALCLACYHEVPRLSGPAPKGVLFESALGGASLNDVCHVIRRGATTAFAEVEFVASDGTRYLAHWGYRAPKRKGAAPKEETWVKNQITAQVLANRKNETAAKIRSLLGLSFDQFTRTVLLAQGQFAAFLRANDTNERTQILEQLTGTERYTTIGSAIAARKRSEDEALRMLNDRKQALSLLADEARAELEARRAEYSLSLEAYVTPTTLLAQLLSFVERRQRAERSMAELVPRIAQLRTEVGAMRERHDACLADDAELRRRWQELQPELERAIGLDHELATLDGTLQAERKKLQSRQNALAERSARITRDRTGLEQWRRELEKLEQWLAPRAAYSPLAREQRFIEAQLRAYLKSHLDRPVLERRIAEAQAKMPELGAAVVSSEQRIAALGLELSGIEVERLPWMEAQLQVRAEQLRFEEELARAKTELTEAEHRLAVLDEPLGAANEQLRKARLAYELGADITAHAVQALRVRLKEGVPCPVCGSADHPYQTQTEEVLRGRVQQLKAELEDAQRHQQALLQDGERFRATAAEHRRALERIGAGLSRTAVEYSAAANCRSREELQMLRERHAACMQAQLALKHAQLQHERATNEQQRLERELASVKEELLRTNQSSCDAEQSLARLWPSAAWAADLVLEGEPFISRKLAKLEHYSKTAERTEALRRDTEKLESSVAAQQLELERAERECSEHAAEVRSREETLTATRSLRATLLAGKSAAATREEWKQRLETAARRTNELGLKLKASEGEETRLATQQSSAETELAETGLLTAEHGPALAQALKLLALRSADPPDDWKETESATLLQWLLATRAALEERRGTLQNEAGALRQRLAQDDENRSKAGSLAEEIAERQTTVGIWRQLHELLGVSDGKAFRELAQQYTLEVLLEQANHRLREITKRYSLRKLADSMHFVVVDHDNYDTARPVHTLSGGESFIVSLALALALSTLVSGNQAIETLFIDEGFGSLDSEALRHVMKALEALHSQGRKVGLITHVEEMKERIPVRVEVGRVGPGRSTVFVVG